MDGILPTISQDERYQDTEEESSHGIQQHFPQMVPTEDHAENMWPPSQVNLQCQAQFHASHRAITTFQRNPHNCNPASVFAHRDATHSVANGPQHHLMRPLTHSVGNAGNVQFEPEATYPVAHGSQQELLRPPAHSVGTAGAIPAPATHSVAAVRSVANQAPFSYAVRYDSSTQHEVPCLADHSSSAAISSPAQDPGTSTGRSDSNNVIVDTLQPTSSRNPVQTATYAVDLGENPETSQRATVMTAAMTPSVAFAAAGGKGPPGHVPDGSMNSRLTDRRHESAFYHNATYTGGTTSNSAPPPFVLMEIPITPFDGDVREYPRFRDRFLDIVETQPNLESRYKLVHLLKYLRGEPLRMADRLHITDENYFIVVDRLEKRYGNKGLLGNALLQDLTDLADLPSTKLSDLTRFYDEAFQIVTDLRPLITNCEVQHRLLMGKIPLKLRVHLMEETSYASDMTTHGLLNALEELVSKGRWLKLSGIRTSADREFTDPDMICGQMEDDASSEHTLEEDSPEGSAQGLQNCPSEPAEEERAVEVNATSEPCLKERRTCPLCGELHTAYRCTTFRTVNGRLRRIMKKKLCLLCLREGHQAGTCPRKTTDSCKICHAGPHNRAVCMTANERTRASNRCRSPARTTGSSVDPKRSDQQRQTQKKSVNWVDTTSLSTATNLRQSETQSSSKSIPKMSRKKKSKKPGAAPSGRDGTSRTLTSSTAESMKQKTAGACGDSRLLPARQGLPRTDRCPNPNESTQFDQTAHANGTKGATQWESSDAEKRHELREAEEDSSSETSGDYSDVTLPTSIGHCSNPDPDDWEDVAVQPCDSNALHIGATARHPPTDDCASSTNEQTTLLECIKVTAENPATGNSRNVIIFFDSGSTRSFVSTEVARDLSLPRQWPSSLRVNTFGNELPTTIEGFSTSIVLSSKHRRLSSLAFIARDCIVTSVRTALVEPSDLPKLRRGEHDPSPLQVTPDILVGQNLVSHFKRQYGPTLPSGFYVVKSILGPMLGGSGKVPTTVPAAATSSIVVTSARVAQWSINLTEATPLPPTLPPNLRQPHAPAHSVGNCTDLAQTPGLTHSVEPELGASRDAACQDFSLRVEKNEFYRSTPSTSRCSGRHTPSDCAAGSRPSRKRTNPLDTTALLPTHTSTTHVMLRQELQPDPNIFTSPGNAPDCRSHSSFPQNPALIKPRKTRLRRHSSTQGRLVMGIKNHYELRKCETMRTLQDQLRSAIQAHNHDVPDGFDSVRAAKTTTHAANNADAKCPEPDTVLVASIDSSVEDVQPSPPRPSDQSVSAGSKPQQLEQRLLEASRPGTQISRRRPADDIWTSTLYAMSDSPATHDSRTATRTPTHSVGTRTELPQSLLAHPAESSTAGPNKHRTIDPHEEDCNHRSISHPPSHSLPNDSSRRTAEASDPTYSVDYQAETVATPLLTHSVGLEQATDIHNNRGQPASEQPPRTSTGSNQCQSANRRAPPHAQDDQLPRIARRTTFATAIDGPSIPVIDGFVSKCFAASLACHHDQAFLGPTVNEDLPPQYKFIGAINHLGVPSSYLPPTKFPPTEPDNSAPLELLTLDHLAQEDDILPWKFILGTTLGALPPYWEMTTAETCIHLHEEAQGSSYRGMHICGFGPTGFFINSGYDHALREYEGQRQSLLRFGRIARSTGKCIVLVVYDQPKTGMDLHAEAVSLLRQAVKLPADHPIHLVAYCASAFQLLHWLETFPNVVFGLEHVQLASLHEALQTTDHASELYLHAVNLQTFFKYVPLKHFAVHSGCPSPHPNGHPGYSQTPTILLKTAELFEKLTGTPKEDLIEQSAYTLNSIYHLHIDLPPRAAAISDSRDESRGRHTIDDLSARLYLLAPGRARRADLDQGISASSRSSAPDATHSVAKVVARSPPYAATKATYRMCALCDKPHPSTECTTFATTNQRLGRIQKLKLCSLCLREGHNAAACPDRTKSSCQHCHRGQHHPAICKDFPPRDAPASTQQVPSELLTASQLRTVAPAATHSVAREAGPTRRRAATGTLSPVDHFRRNDKTPSAMKRDSRATSILAKKRSAAVQSPAQAPSSQPSRPRSKGTTADSPRNEQQVHAPSTAQRSRSNPSEPVKTVNKPWARQRSNNSKQKHSVGKETRHCAPRGEKTKQSSHDKKAYHRSKEPGKPPLAQASSTPVVDLAEADQQSPTEAEHRRKSHKRKEREPKK